MVFRENGVGISSRQQIKTGLNNKRRDYSGGRKGKEMGGLGGVVEPFNISPCFTK